MASTPIGRRPGTHAPAARRSAGAAPAADPILRPGTLRPAGPRRRTRDFPIGNAGARSPASLRTRTTRWPTWTSHTAAAAESAAARGRSTALPRTGASSCHAGPGSASSGGNASARNGARAWAAMRPNTRSRAASSAPCPKAKWPGDHRPVSGKCRRSAVAGEFLERCVQQVDLQVRVRLQLPDQPRRRAPDRFERLKIRMVQNRTHLFARRLVHLRRPFQAPRVFAFRQVRRHDPLDEVRQAPRLGRRARSRLFLARQHALQQVAAQPPGPIAPKPPGAEAAVAAQPAASSALPPVAGTRPSGRRGDRGGSRPVPGTAALPCGSCRPTSIAARTSSRLSESTARGLRPAMCAGSPRLARPLKSPASRMRNGVSSSSTPREGCSPAVTSSSTDDLEKRSGMWFVTASIDSTGL